MPNSDRRLPLDLAAAGLFAMAAAVGIGRFIYTPILPFMVQDLGWTSGDAGLVASANFLGYLAGALTAAWFRTGSSPRLQLVLALAVSTATTLAMAAVTGMAPILLLRFTGGVASAYVLVLASSLVLERLAQMGRAPLSAVHFSGVGIGIAISALVTWAAVMMDLGWRAIWLGGGCVALIALFAVSLLVPESGPTSAAAPSVATGVDRGQRRRVGILIASYGLFGFGYVITATFIVAMARGAGMGRGLEVAIWLSVGIAAAVSVPVWTAIGRRIGVIEAFAVATLVEAIGVVASVVWVSMAGLVVAGAMLGATFMGITALGLIAGRSLAGLAPQKTLGSLTAAFGLGQVFGPLAAGYGYDLTGGYALPSLLAAAALVAAAGLALSIRSEAAGPAKVA